MDVSDIKTDLLMGVDESDDGVNNENLTPEQLRQKMIAIRDLCSSDKLTTLNPFDINMIDYLSSWLNKTKDIEDVESFEEIAGNLEAVEKIYSLRVNSLSEDTTKLYEQLKKCLYGKINVKKEDSEDSEDEKSLDGDEITLENYGKALTLWKNQLTTMNMKTQRDQD